MSSTQLWDNYQRRFGSQDGQGAGDHDQPYRFGWRPRASVPYPFNTRQYARLLAYATPRTSMRRSLVQQERGRLASDLHDTVAQTLYGISLSAARLSTLLARSETAQVQSVVEELLHLANDGETELRTRLHDLRSDQPLPLQGGLIGALASLATGLESRTGSQVRLSLADEPDLANTTKATLIRIAREALHNIAKHARATHVDLVSAPGRGTQVRIRVVRLRQ
jgi:signal transduction histidine kinase